MMRFALLFVGYCAVLGMLLLTFWLIARLIANRARRRAPEIHTPFPDERRELICLPGGKCRRAYPTWRQP